MEGGRKQAKANSDRVDREADAKSGDAASDSDGMTQEGINFKGKYELESIPNSTNLNYYETIAEVMENLKSEQMETSKTGRVKKSGKRGEGDGEAESRVDERDLFSLYKSLYNSSKLFPQTQKELEAEATRLSELFPKKIEKHTSQKVLKSVKDSERHFGTERRDLESGKHFRESILLENGGNWAETDEASQDQLEKRVKETIETLKTKSISHSRSSVDFRKNVFKSSHISSHQNSSRADKESQLRRTGSNAFRKSKQKEAQVEVELSPLAVDEVEKEEGGEHTFRDTSLTEAKVYPEKEAEDRLKGHWPNKSTSGLKEYLRNPRYKIKSEKKKTRQGNVKHQLLKDFKRNLRSTNVGAKMRELISKNKFGRSKSFIGPKNESAATKFKYFKTKKCKSGINEPKRNNSTREKTKKGQEGRVWGEKETQRHAPNPEASLARNKSRFRGSGKKDTKKVHGNASESKPTLKSRFRIEYSRSKEMNKKRKGQLKNLVLLKVKRDEKDTEGSGWKRRDKSRKNTKNGCLNQKILNFTKKVRK